VRETHRGSHGSRSWSLSRSLPWSLPAFLLTAALLAGCGSDGSGDQDDPAPDAPEGAAGVYDTAVVLLNSTCEGIAVQDAATTVEQESGSDTVELTQAGTTYTAQLTDDGQFTSDPVEVPLGDQTQSLTLHGSFSDQGLRASVLAAVVGGAGGPCTYEVSWVGTRQP
jgi:hypothetical protein